jgi:hypothetical protein
MSSTLRLHEIILGLHGNPAANMTMIAIIDSNGLANIGDLFVDLSPVEILQVGYLLTEILVAGVASRRCITSAASLLKYWRRCLAEFGDRSWAMALMRMN